MIGEALRRLYVRYFGVAATSVSPQFAPNPVSMTVAFQPFSPASDPPKAPDTKVGGPSVTPWAEWQWKINQHYTPLGWTFCKFGVRGPGPDETGEVWGIVRDGFGAYWCRFYIHAHETGDHGEQFLAVAVNVRSGYAFGIFSQMDQACEAVEIALRLSRRAGLDHSFDEPEGFEAYRLLTHAMITAGYGQGAIICRPMKGADVIQGAPIPVWMRPESEARPAEVRPS